MPSDFPESKRASNLDGDKALETFSFEVSAGNSANGDPSFDNSASDIDVDETPPDERAKPERTAIAASKSPTRKVASQSHRKTHPPSPKSPRFTTAKKNGLHAPAAKFEPIKKHIKESKPSRRSMPSLSVSLAIHAVALLLLSFYTLATLHEENISLYANMAAYEEVDDFQEIPIDPSETLESLESDFVAELSDPDAPTLGELSAESALADVADDTMFAPESLGEFGNLMGDIGSGLAESGDGIGAEKVSFFGTTIEGRRIVYLVDNSGGMRRGEFETLVDALLESVDSLTPKQMFYVIFYSDSLYPLFYPQPVQRFVKATDKNKQLLRNWLDTVEFCLGNVVDEAIAAAVAIRPDVVYLLTDGDLDGTRDQRRLRFLLDSTNRRFSVHTFGMGTGEEGEAARKLKLVAEANRGMFRAVQVTSEAKERAREKKRPYHNKEPGAVWGLRVGSR